MISVGSRDGRKGLGLGFDAEAEMEETELEEGEACSYQNDDYSTIDPDVALSYIDEKLQDVLGHFQKEFEGGVSAENLGSKFGGYGSFLPTYQHSPVRSHPRTPPKVHNTSTPRSPNTLHLEGGRHNSIVPSSASLLVRHAQASATAASLPLLRASVSNSAERYVGVSSAHCVEVSTSGCELGKDNAQPSDQKTLKVRIKVGSDDLSTRKSAEIYTGLGLDFSPASSLDDILTDSEGFTRGHHDGPDESPTSILQIMTSFPVHGNLLLSPLPGDLFYLTEKERHRGESKPRFLQKGGQQSSNGSNARGDEKLIGGRKTPSFEKNAYSIELKNLNGEDAQNRNGILLKKETDIETLDCEELVASALKLPLLSNSSSHVVNSANGTSRIVDNSKVANKVKEESLPDLAKEETLEAVSTQEIGLVEKHSGKSASAGQVWEGGKANFNGDILIYPKKDGNVKGEKVDLSAKADLNVSKGRNAEPFDPLEQKVTKVWQDPKANFNDDILIYPKKDGNVKGEKVDVSAKADSNVFKGRNAEPFDPLEQKASKKATSREEDDLQLAFEKENSSSGAKTKPKGSQSHSGHGAEVPKDRSRMDSFLPKNRKSTHANYYLPKSGLEDSKLQKDNGKARNRYRDFFGDIELDQGDNDVDSAEMPSRGRPMDVVTVEKSTLASNGMLNGKKMDKPPTSEPYSKAALNAAPIAGNGSISDAAPGTLGPLVKEYWVCCDKCQKWRLLPLGTNPDSLPEKWLCSMLNWLPGMNRCSISQEETTKEVIARYQVSAPENQNNKHGHPDDVLPELSVADASCFDHNRQNLGFHPMPSGGKKKNGIKEVSAAVGQVAPAQVSDSSKKNLQAAVKSRSSNVVKHAPLVNEAEPMHLSRSSAVEKHRHNKREKNKALKQYSDGGETRSSNIKSKRENDQDCFRNSKKIKIDGMHCADEDWIPDHDELGERVGPGSSQYPSGKDRHRYNDHSSRDKCEANNSSKGPRINPKDQVLATSDDGCQRMEKLDDKDVVRKRKINESQDTHVYTTSLLSGHQVHDKRDFLEQTSENIHRKEKKARVSKSEGKKTSMSTRSGGASQKGRSTKDQLLGPDRESSLSQRSLDATDSLRRDLRPAQPSQAATSSSSKVSGSHKSKTNMHEAKGSPVESVSSSPLRFSNPDKSTSTMRSLGGKYNFGGAGLFATGTSRRCSDGEDDKGTNRSGTVRKDETLFSNQGSLESFMLDFQERDMGSLADSEAKKQIVQCPEFVNGQFSNGDTDTLGNGTRYPCKPQASNQHCYEERGNDKEYRANMSQPRKSGKGSSSRSKHKNGSFKSELDKGKVKISDSCNESIDHIPCNEENLRAGKNGVQEKLGVNSDEVEKNAMDKKEPAGEVETEISKRESQTKFVGVDSLDDKVDALCSQDPNLNMRLDRDERSSKRYLSDKTDQAEVSRRGKSHLLPPAGRVYNETVTHSLDLNPGSQKENGGNNVIIEAFEGGDALKAPKQIYKSENQNGNQLITSRNPTVNGHRVRDVDAPSPVRRDSSNQATNAVKEAKDLKHLADRLKNSGSSAESASLYFQAALKFLHGASLFESSNGEGAKQSEMIQSMQIYSSTAKLCEFCAHEYEKAKDMAAAALAYKCTEIAYMRVVYSSRAIASRDRHDLQTALQIHPPGESPSSSASDVDNLNHPATLDKVPLAKGVSSPQVAGSHHISARNRPSFVRLLNFAQDVNSAMEASRKSRMAFLAANLRKEEAQYKEGITSVKMALDFNFQDVEGLLHLVRLAMEAIGR